MEIPGQLSVEINITASASKGTTEIVRYQNGAIQVTQDGVVMPVVVKEVLREIAPDVGVYLIEVFEIWLDRV